MKIIILAWKTDVMPVSAYWSFCADCYDDSIAQRLGNAVEGTREIDVSDIAASASCSVRGVNFREGKVAQ